MLATDNETAAHHPTGYPSIMFYPKGLEFMAKPVYVGSRDYAGLTKFLQEKSIVYQQAKGLNNQSDL